MPVLDPKALIENRVNAIREYHEQAGVQRAELDVSGGIDSAVMLGLLAKALGPENITAVYSSVHSSAESLTRAREVSKTFGVSLININLTEHVDRIRDAMAMALHAAGYNLGEICERTEADGTIDGSFRSCIRAPVGRYFNRLTGGGIRHGTGNECEDRWLRFYQKGGDGEVDTNPIAMLSKGEVYQLAVALGVPRSIIDCMPTPDLQGVGEAHNDEDELKALSGLDWTYSRVDPETGEYTKVGTIERLSRFLDHEFAAWWDAWRRVKGELLFEPEKLRDPNVEGGWVMLDMQELAADAESFFPGSSLEEVAYWLISARKWEASTRHKMNPNCPSLGDRKSLLGIGILTNDLPE